MYSQAARDFSDFVTDLRGGQAHSEMSQALNEAAKAVMDGKTTLRKGVVVEQVVNRLCP